MFICVNLFSKYNESMLFTLESIVYIGPCLVTPVGSNARLSKIRPFALCIGWAHVSCIGSFFCKVVQNLFLEVGFNFSIQNIGVQVVPIFSSYN